MKSFRIGFLLPAILLLLSSLFCSCRTESKSANNNPSKTLAADRPKQAIQFGAIDHDRLRIESDSSANYYARLKSRLKNISESMDLLFVQGEGPENSRLFSHNLMGTYTVAVKNDSTFHLQGKMILPKTGKWDEGFRAYESFNFNLQVGNHGWSVTDLHLPSLNLKPDLANIDSLREQLGKAPDCVSKDWEKAATCFALIERYEFALFASITAGDTTYLDDYLSLQQNFDVTYAGEFAEYYRGNIYYLLLAQIITPEYLIESDTSNNHGFVRMVYRF
jgi:hypothetical protein